MHRHRHVRRPSDAAVMRWQFVLLIALAAGCAAQKKTPTSQPSRVRPAEQSMSNIDPCALRLHDLEGGLLLYYAQHGTLPPNLATLELPGGIANAAEALICPVSSQPYIYDPRGLPAPDGKSRLVVYDSIPAHGTSRWAIAILESGGGQPLIAEVIAAPESCFAAPRGP